MLLINPGQGCKCKYLRGYGMSHCGVAGSVCGPKRVVAVANHNAEREKEQMTSCMALPIVSIAQVLAGHWSSGINARIPSSRMVLPCAN